MLRPSYNQLIQKANENCTPEEPVVRSRYSIVLAAAKRARQLVDGNNPYVNGDIRKPLSVAVSELNEGKVRIVPYGSVCGEENAEVSEEETAAAETETGADGIEVTETETNAAEIAAAGVETEAGECETAETETDAAEIAVADVETDADECKTAETETGAAEIAAAETEAGADGFAAAEAETDADGLETVDETETDLAAKEAFAAEPSEEVQL